VRSIQRDPLKPLLHLLAALLLTVACASAVAAGTLSDYRYRIKQAISALDGLMQSDETESEAQYNTRAAETLVRVRSIIPESETVEWDNNKTQVDNRWLHQALEQYAKSAAGPTALRPITERLQALEERLAEIDTAVARKLTSEEAAARLAEILRRAEYAQKGPNETALSKLWRDFKRWLEQLIPKREPLAPGQANFFTLFAQIFVIVLALAVIVYALRMLWPRLFKGGRKAKSKKSEARVVLGEKLRPDQTAGDLLTEAEALAREGLLRAAIRKAYIALLVELGDRKIISLAQHKTNRDYLRSVREIEPLHRSMTGLTESFEKHWYGLSGASEDDWKAFRDGYRKTLAGH
jgi:hypothetical protein